MPLIFCTSYLSPIDISYAAGMHFDPAHTTTLVLSQDNTIATAPASANGAAKGIVPKTSGKWQFEVVPNFSGVVSIGIANSGAANFSAAGSFGRITNNVAGIYFNVVDGLQTQNDGAHFDSNGIVSVYVDLDNFVMYMSFNGVRILGIGIPADTYYPLVAVSLYAAGQYGSCRLEQTMTYPTAGYTLWN